MAKTETYAIALAAVLTVAVATVLILKSGQSPAEVSSQVNGTASCDESRGLVRCGGAGECVDPWINPCDESYDSGVIQRLANVNRIVGGQFGYPAPTVIDWRQVVNNDIVQVNIEGLAMEADDTGILSGAEAAIVGQGFEEDINNMADGAGSGRRGYVLGSTVCVVEFQAVESYGPDEPAPDRVASELKDISVSCGRLD